MPETESNLRSAMVMTADRKGIFDILYSLSRLGLGGTIAGVTQYTLDP